MDVVLIDPPQSASPCVTSPTTSETGGSAQQQNMANRCSPLLKRSDDLKRSTKNGKKLAQEVMIRNHVADMLLSDVLQIDSTSGLPWRLERPARKASWQQCALSMAEEVSWNSHIHILCPIFNVQHIHFHNQFQADIWWQTTTSPFMRTNETRRKRSPSFNHMDKATGLSTSYFLLPPALMYIPRKSKKHVQRKIQYMLSCTWEEGPTDCN